MKKRLVLLPVILAAVFLIVGCRYVRPVSHPTPLPGTALTQLYFSESNSYFKRVQGYEFKAEDGAYTAYFYMANEEELYPVKVDQTWINTLTSFISQYNMKSWDGFQGSDSMLLDGTHFAIDFTFADGTTVRASGYGCFPKNYGDASASIDAHFLQLLPEDMRDW